MAFAVILELDGVTLSGELGDGPAARALWERLPVSLSLSRWGQEYYGALPQPLPGLGGPTRDEMQVGELAYWEPGQAFCLFFGPTPASRGGEPRAASPVHPVGMVHGDWQAISALGPGVAASLKKA